ncbi:MAG: nucleotidyltransferase domain-containing protein [Anaerolineales bacterium]|nr:nucleotidyltransferase domain-containing protein [Anaerolineales bacterium]
MTENLEKPLNRLVEDLKERAKELNCLYEVQETLGKPGVKTELALERIIEVIPPGWQYPDICQSEITFGDKVFRATEFNKTPWVQHSDIIVQDQAVGRISVYYLEEKPDLDEGPFLREERRLINTIADQVGNFLLHQRLQDVFEKQSKKGTETRAGWWVVLNLLQKTDPGLLITIARKMVHLLSGRGVKEAEGLLELFSSVYREDREILETNFPYQFKTDGDAIGSLDEVFVLAEKNLDEDELLSSIQQWIREDQSGFLINALVQPGCSLSEISSALDRFQHLSTQGLELSTAREQSVRVSLIRRLLSGHDKFIKTAKNYINIDDFSNLSSNIIFQSGSYGKLGGKSAGIFLAMEIIKKAQRNQEMLKQVKTPKTWYIVSDTVFSYIEQNNLEEIIEHKYLNIEEIRQEYPYIIHVFKNAPLPPEILKGLSVALDDFGDVPLIVRSSSLLEDQVGMSFAGKYKSLFVANQGTKEERLKSLVDAITEVYASMYSPDPIEYRIEHGLIDHHEEMGILIQEVVGRRVGPYYFPTYAGVAFSQNEFRWSSRIQKEDGLVRIVPGLGTRAVDRISDDYPIMAAPGQPGLRVNTSLEEVVRYSPQMIDVINLEKGTFETIDIQKLLKEFGSEIPNIKQLVSIITQDHSQIPTGLGPDFEKDKLIFTFDGLFSQSPFLSLLRAILTELQEKLDHPVDIEFAYDGDDFYLLQCRSQSYGAESIPANIPTDIPADKVIFTASRYISNGTIPNISHVVYVDPAGYSLIPTREEMLEVGRAVSKLNKILTKRKFILMGPGRWGSRGDIKLGVNVTYSDINNTAALIEIAQKRGDYIPDLSFGTHFFQDLIESAIRYIPLYPDDHGIIFNKEFLLDTDNILGDLLPEYVHLEKIIHVIDVKQCSGGSVVQILMNAEKNHALAMLADEDNSIESVGSPKFRLQTKPREDYWRWRLKSAEQIAASIDPDRFGVKGIYIFGSTKNATAGPQSDIDLLIHFVGSDDQLEDLTIWLEGWSLSLGKINEERTGYKTNGLLDVAIITDEDIKNKSSYAVKIGAVSDAALPLSLGTAQKT